MREKKLKYQVLEVIKRKKEISRIELAKELNVSPASIGKSVKELLEDKSIIESGYDISSGGRKPLLLKINDKNFGEILGIYFAPKCIYVSVGNIDGKIELTRVCNIEEKGEDIFVKGEKIVENILNKNKDIKIISVVLNGLVDTDRGILIFSPHYNVRNFNIKDRFIKKFNKKVVLENDVRSMALTEKVFGNCKNNHNFVVLNIEDGVGGSIFLNDALYHGYGSISGELGHMTVKRESLERCLCGKKGCLETEVSNRAIIKKIITQIKINNKYTSLKKILEVNRSLSIDDVIKAYKEKDMLSLNILGEAIYYIAYAIDMIISVINPEKIILFGDIFKSKEILENLLKEIRKITLDEQNYQIEVSNFLSDIYLKSPFALANYNIFTLKSRLKR